MDEHRQTTHPGLGNRAEHKDRAVETGSGLAWHDHDQEKPIPGTSSPPALLVADIDPEALIN
jgi:hypothetical protein